MCGGLKIGGGVESRERRCAGPGGSPTIAEALDTHPYKTIRWFSCRPHGYSAVNCVCEPSFHRYHPPRHCHTHLTGSIEKESLHLVLMWIIFLKVLKSNK